MRDYRNRRTAFTASRTLHDIVSRDQLTFQDVTERAWILYDGLSGDGDAVLSRVAGDLLDLGNRLDGIFDELAEISKMHPKV